MLEVGCSEPEVQGEHVDHPVHQPPPHRRGPPHQRHREAGRNQKNDSIINIRNRITFFQGYIKFCIPPRGGARGGGFLRLMVAFQNRRKNEREGRNKEGK